MTLPDLIERLERASGPDRELDAEIALACGKVPEGAFRPCAAIDVGTFGTGPHSFWSCDPYTASIDAALTLVPEGWCWMAGERNPGRFRAYVNNNKLMSDPKCEWYEVVCNSTAHAICIAALRAREADRG